jgi:hypothetical protein
MMKPTHKKNIKKLAQDPDCIAGIYNYCDRWCERCPFTPRCMTFKLSEEKFGDPEARDINNAVFWEKLSETFNETLNLLREMAEEEGIDLDSITAESDDENRFLDKDNTVIKVMDSRQGISIPSRHGGRWCRKCLTISVRYEILKKCLD